MAGKVNFLVIAVFSMLFILIVNAEEGINHTNTSNLNDSNIINDTNSSDLNNTNNNSNESLINDSDPNNDTIIENLVHNEDIVNASENDNNEIINNEPIINGINTEETQNNTKTQEETLTIRII